MTKQRGRSQRLGRRGEDCFRLFAGEHGVLPTKVEEDLGFDFLCQVEQPSASESRRISGTVLGAAVRSTGAQRPRVRLVRSDAQAMLQAGFIVVFVFVRLTAKNHEVRYRFLDEAFAHELASFLESEQGSLTISPADCRPVSKFDEDLAEALRGNLPERLRVAMAGRLVRRHLPEARLWIQRGPEGEVAIVESVNFFDFFVRDPIPQTDAVHNAIFGSPRLRAQRLTELGARPEIYVGLEELDVATSILVGSTSDQTITILVESGNAPPIGLDFLELQNSTHFGWVYSAGFSITFSAAKRVDDEWIHELVALVDDGEDLLLSEHPELWKFLEQCRAESRLRRVNEDSDRSIATHWIRGLARANFYAANLRKISMLRGWKSVDVPLRLAVQDESLHSTAFLAELAVRPNFLEGFGFFAFVSTAASPDVPPAEYEFVSEEALVQVPIVANIGCNGVVAWVTAEISVCRESDEVTGFRIDRVSQVDLEAVGNFDKSTVYPEIVVNDTWPVVSFQQGGPVQCHSRPSGWGVEFRFAP